MRMSHEDSHTYCFWIIVAMIMLMMIIIKMGNNFFDDAIGNDRPRMSARRKITMSGWGAPSEPATVCFMSL